MATLIDAAPTAAIPAGYPRELEREIRLQDGAAAQIRPVRPDDAERLIELYDRLSYTTAYQRFFRVLKRLPPEWARLFANVDYHGRLALVAQHDAPHGPELVGVARYEPSDEPGTVEVAVVVQDGWQGRGLGVTAGFAALGFVVPGLSFADLLVNPLIVRAFTREQEISADRKAVLILGAMGHERPRRTLASALRAAAAVNGPDKGGAFAKEPDLEARLGALEPLERFGVAVKSSAPLRR